MGGIYAKVSDVCDSRVKGDFPLDVVWELSTHPLRR